MENPFDLRGPQFLLFFLCFAIAVTLLQRRIRILLERGDEPRPLSDYLEIAYLRGGTAEAIRVAILALVDRGALTVSDDTVSADRDAAHRVSKATERAILTKAAHGAKTDALVSATEVKEAVDKDCRPELLRRGLLPSRSQQAVRLALWLLAFGTLALVAWQKIQIALERGRTNIEFLVILTGIFFFVTLAVSNPNRTPAGDALVEDLRTLFGGLKDRAPSFKPRQGGNVALLAAVYGVGLALPVYPDAHRLFPKASSSSSGSSGSSCGSSCGSSGGSSCGSSCGGGGGGCGGCGS